MSGNLLVRFDEGRVGRTRVSPSLLLYGSGAGQQGIDLGRIRSSKNVAIAVVFSDSRGGGH